MSKQIRRRKNRKEDKEKKKSKEVESLEGGVCVAGEERGTARGRVTCLDHPAGTRRRPAEVQASQQAVPAVEPAQEASGSQLKETSKMIVDGK